jgi:hypothetical protein
VGFGQHCAAAVLRGFLRNLNHFYFRKKWTKRKRKKMHNCAVKLKDNTRPLRPAQIGATTALIKSMTSKGQIRPSTTTPMEREKALYRIWGPL